MSSQDVREQRYSWSNDGDLADEIRIYGDLVVAASESSGTLSVTQIDAALGLADPVQDDERGPAAAAEG